MSLKVHRQLINCVLFQPPPEPKLYAEAISKKFKARKSLIFGLCLFYYLTRISQREQRRDMRYKTSYECSESFMEWKYAVSDIDIRRRTMIFSQYEFWLTSVRNCNHNK